MNLRTCCALLLVAACATTEPRAQSPAARNPRHSNLEKAAGLPWVDEGRCVVQEASQDWGVVVERCFHALDRRKIRFNDVERRCTVATAEAAAVPTLVGICLLTQPEIVVGAVIIIGVVVVGVVIAEELESYKREWKTHPLAEDSAGGPRPVTGTRPARERQASANPRPQPGGAGSTGDLFPPVPPQPRRRECEPVPTPHLGGDALHNQCADEAPQNDFPGYDALVNGKHFDAVELSRRILWEVKTDNFDTYPLALQRIVLGRQLLELQRERDLARACGFEFRVGVRSTAHRNALNALDLSLNIVVMDWC